jgi:hypothetical protein
MEDIRLICPEDCGNAPRKALLRDFTFAAVRQDLDFIMKHLADSVVWEIAGKQQTVGQASFADAIRQWHAKPAVLLEIRHIITHGRTGAVSGVVTYDGSSRSFCDVYEFAGASRTAKLKKMTSYIIDLELSEQSKSNF